MRFADIAGSLPGELILILGVILMTVLSATRISRSAQLVLAIGLVLAASVFPFIWFGQEEEGLLDGLWQSDWSRFLQLLASGALVFLLVFTNGFSVKGRTTPPEIFPLLLAMLTGIWFAVLAKHYLVMLVSLEIVSISAYILTTGFSFRKFSSEGGLKYLLFGGFSTAISVYGFSWLYGFSGTIDIYSPNFAHCVNTMPGWLIQVLCMGMTLSLFAFKMSAIPMHFWSPDVYQASSWPLAAWFSIGPKIAGLGALANFILPLTGDPYFGWKSTLIIVLSAFSLGSMIIGNFSAIRQKSIWRLLAFSGVSHSGFLLFGLLLFSWEGYAASFYYLLAYSIMTLGLFFFAGWMDQENMEEWPAQKPDWKKVVILILFVAGLTGLPATAGFTAKFSLFASFAGELGNYWFAKVFLAIALLNILPALYFYLRIPARMVFQSGSTKSEPRLQHFPWLAMILLAIPTIWLGFLHFDAILRLLTRHP